MYPDSLFLLFIKSPPKQQFFFFLSASKVPSPGAKSSPDLAVSLAWPHCTFVKGNIAQE
jgi:hypothetical protein